MKFISFDDILKDKDILKDIDVIINVGDRIRHTGRAVWEECSYFPRPFVNLSTGAVDLSVSGSQAGRTNIRDIIYGLLILISVEKETGFTLNYDKYNWEEHKNHFILADTTKPVDFGEEQEEYVCV